MMDKYFTHEQDLLISVEADGITLFPQKDKQLSSLKILWGDISAVHYFYTVAGGKYGLTVPFLAIYSKDMDHIIKAVSPDYQETWRQILLKQNNAFCLPLIGLDTDKTSDKFLERFHGMSSYDRFFAEFKDTVKVYSDVPTINVGHMAETAWFYFKLIRQYPNLLEDESGLRERASVRRMKSKFITFIIAALIIVGILLFGYFL